MSIQKIANYAELARDFLERSEAILPSQWAQYQTILTVLFVLLCMYQQVIFFLVSSLLTSAFVSLAVTLLNRKAGFVAYLAGAGVASIAVALSAVYVCNFFGVYI